MAAAAAAQAAAGGAGGGGVFDPAADDDGTRALKRSRLVWTPQLHRRFLDAVEKLGDKAAVPKTIMNVRDGRGGRGGGDGVGARCRARAAATTLLPAPR
jgi:hypothetical protein